MNNKTKNILIIFGGIIIGSIVNMIIISISHFFIPLPEGVDVTNAENLKTSIHLFKPLHFIFPFIAHALGTFVGSFFSCYFHSINKLKAVFVVGIWFLFGGVVNTILLSAPAWFNFIDLSFAYIPMSYLAFLLFKKFKSI